MVDTKINRLPAKVNGSRVKSSRLVIRYSAHLPRGRVNCQHFRIESRSESRVNESNIRSIAVQMLRHVHEACAVAAEARAVWGNQ